MRSCEQSQPRRVTPVRCEHALSMPSACADPCRPQSRAALTGVADSPPAAPWQVLFISRADVRAL